MRHTRTPLGLAVIFVTMVVAISPAPSAVAALETPVSEPATGVTATEATLHGELNPNASATAGYSFDYNPGGSCEGRSTEAGPEATGQGIKVHTLVAGLVPSTEYTFCVVVSHSEGELVESVLGAPLSFTTASLAPTVDGESASAITPISATLEAQVNPENETTTSCVFEYGTTTAYGTTVPCEPETLEGFGDQTVTYPLEGLEPATTYHFRTVVANVTGTTEGADGEFTTAPFQAPVVDSEIATAVTTTDARLEAQVNPNYQETTYSFEYSANEALSGAITVTGAAPFPAGFGDQSASVDLSGALQPGTTYFYRVTAQNGTGTTDGAVQSFTTVGPPLVTTGSAGSITRSSVQLHGGTIDPVGAQVSFFYRYITQAGYEHGLSENPADPYAKGATTLPFGSVLAGFETRPVPVVAISELFPATTYHFALVAINSAGTTIGLDATFTTAAPTPPRVSVGPAVEVGHTTARIVGTVDPAGLDTTWELQLSSEPGAFNTVTAGSLPASAGATDLTLGLSFLAPGVSYRYRVAASNPDGTVSTNEGSFTTQAFPTPAGLPPAPAPVPYTPIAVLQARESATTGHSQPSLTRRQSLAKALKACRRKHGRERAACERQARRKYGPERKTNKTKSKHASVLGPKP